MTWDSGTCICLLFFLMVHKCVCCALPIRKCSIINVVLINLSFYSAFSPQKEPSKGYLQQLVLLWRTGCSSSPRDVVEVSLKQTILPLVVYHAPLPTPAPWGPEVAHHELQKQWLKHQSMGLSIHRVWGLEWDETWSMWYGKDFLLLLLNRGRE